MYFSFQSNKNSRIFLPLKIKFRKHFQIFRIFVKFQEISYHPKMSSSVPFTQFRSVCTSHRGQWHVRVTLLLFTPHHDAILFVLPGHDPRENESPLGSDNLRPISRHFSAKRHLSPKRQSPTCYLKAQYSRRTSVPLPAYLLSVLSSILKPTKLNHSPAFDEFVKLTQVEYY